MIAIEEIMRAHQEGYLSKGQATEAIRLLVERELGQSLPSDDGGTPPPAEAPAAPLALVDADPVAGSAASHARMLEESRTARLARTIPSRPGKRLLAKRHYKQNEPPVPHRHFSRAWDWRLESKRDDLHS